MNTEPETPQKGLPKAVALGFELGQDDVPMILASGKGRVAQEILKIAEEKGITIVNDPAVARALTAVAPGQEIPVPLYRAVAEVLAFVYGLKDRA